MISRTKNGSGQPSSLKSKEAHASKKRELDQLAMETLHRVIDATDESLELEKQDKNRIQQFSDQINDTLAKLLEEEGRQLALNDKQRVIRQVMDEVLGYGPINVLLEDTAVTEIMINGYDNIYIERNGKLAKSEITFRDNEHVSHILNKIIHPLGRRLDESCPSVDARLPDGSRVNAIIPPLSLRGPCVTIRKFSAEPFTLENLIAFHTLNREMADFLTSCIRARVNMIISGGTGSGKTTTLNVLSGFIPGGERIVTIEDTAELQLHQDNLVPLESRSANVEGKGKYTIRELVINSLRMRPDRIVIGEVRGGEALDMLQAMNTGHEGSISTLHANSPRDALARLETMVLMAGMELPLKAIREQITAAIELIVQQSRLSDGSRKITRISEVLGLEGDSIQLRDIFVYKQEGFDEEGRITGRHLPTGIKPRVMEKLWAAGETFQMEEIPGGVEGERSLQPAREQVEELEAGAQGLLEEQEEKLPGEVVNARNVIPPESLLATGILSDPLLSLETEAPAAAEIGEEAVFNITVLNRGQGELCHIRVCDQLLNWETYLESLAPGQYRAFEVPISIPGNRGDFLEGITFARAETPCGKTLEVQSAYGTEVLTPQLRLAVSGPAQAEPGQDASLTFTVKNESQHVDLFRLQLSDSFLQWSETLPSLAAGEVKLFKVACRVPESLQQLSSVLRLSAETRFGEPATARESWSLAVTKDPEGTGQGRAPLNLALSRTGSGTGRADSEERNAQAAAGSRLAETAWGQEPGGVQVEGPKPLQITRGFAGRRGSPSKERPLRLVNSSLRLLAGAGSEPAHQRRGIARDIPREMRGICLPFNAVSGMSLLLQPGDGVDVICLEPLPGNRQRCTTVQRALVLAVVGAEQCGEGGTARIALAVPREQAEALACACLTGSFHLTLRPAEDKGRKKV